MFCCGHNAGRSQMAQAFFNHLNKNPKFVAESAGTNIANEINKQCVEAMKEIGIDMGDKKKYYPKAINPKRKYFRIYTMGCNVQCPIDFYKDLALDDPAGKPVEEVRIIRDQVKEKILEIINNLNSISS